MVGHEGRERLVPLADRLKRLPFWLLAILLLGVIVLWSIVSRQDYRVIFSATLRGLITTLWVSLVSFGLAIILGLLIALARVSTFRVLREAATFWVEIIRGIPMLVILYYIAFVGAPALAQLLGALLAPLVRMRIVPPIDVHSISFSARAVLALTIGYSAFISEIFRAGIESIHRGQWEAAFALGLSRPQAMVHVILPQAIKNVLPPVGNEFIAIIKDSALVSALGVQDITQMGKVYAAGTFKFFETYNVVAFLYLVMTISLSMLVRLLEKRLKRS